MIDDTPSTVNSIVISPDEIPEQIARITAGDWSKKPGQNMHMRALIIFPPVDKSRTVNEVWLVRNGTPWRGSILLPLKEGLRAVRADSLTDSQSGLLSAAHTRALQQYIGAQVRLHLR